MPVPHVATGRSAFTTHHQIVSWLVTEVIVVVHAVGFVFPTARHVECFIKQQEATGSIALAVTEHGDHHVPIGQTVNSMRSGEVSLRLDLLRFDNLVQLWRTLIRGIDDVDATGAIARNDEEVARFALITMTRATGIP